uniref:DUF5801 repeats-in-toxin domain-containing protein n=1 Tax=Kiloniella sp. GXU_MW_B19 TaxID=3141326 RepID=UPI0031CF880E
ESLSISGDLEFSPGADGGEITSVAFAGYEDTEDSDPSGSTITSGDKTVVFTQTVVDGDIVLSGTVDGGSTPVLTVTVDQATGAYSVELFKAIDHPDLSLEDDANDRDPLTLNFDYTVTDGDGDTATATLSVVVEDEEADAHDVFAGTLNEADLSDGNTANDQLSGVLDVDANPDGIRVVGLRFEGWEDGEDGRPEGEVLRSGDQNVVFGDVTTNGDGDLVLVGTIDNGATDIITLVVDPDSFEYTITLNGPINHPDRSVDGSNLNDPLDLNFGFLTRDGDGDEDEETLTVTIQDDTPTVGSNTDLELSEVDDVSSASAVLAHDFGADGEGQLALTAVTVPEGFTSRSEANGSFTVLQNNVAVLSVALAANGEYTVTQIGEIFLNSNAAETFEFGVSYSVTDADDDVVNGSAGFNVEVQGDFEGSGVGIFLGVNSAGTGMSGFGRGILSDNDTSRGEIINDSVGFWIDGDEERDELNIDDFTDEDGVLTTTEQADYVFGDTSGNRVNLGGGNDQFDDRGGNSGADIVDGGEGRDTIWTGDNDDVLIGGAGDDRLFGEAGNDILIGGEGNDRIYGASGEDTIVLNKAGDGVDRLIGFNANQDTLNISDILADNGVDETADISEFINVVQQNGNTVIQAKDADSGQFENVAVISNQSLDLDDLTVSKVDVDF